MRLDVCVVKIKRTCVRACCVLVGIYRTNNFVLANDYMIVLCLCGNKFVEKYMIMFGILIMLTNQWPEITN